MTNNTPPPETQPLTLTDRTVAPFSAWTDFSGVIEHEHGTYQTVVTFSSMSHYLWSKWFQHCVTYRHPECDHETVKERVNCDKSQRTVTPENFDTDHISYPGVYRDTIETSDSTTYEGYTIIVPYETLTPKNCVEQLQVLNETYNRSFRLGVTEQQIQESSYDPEPVAELPLITIIEHGGQ